MSSNMMQPYEPVMNRIDSKMAPPVFTSENSMNTVVSESHLQATVRPQLVHSFSPPIIHQTTSLIHQPSGDFDRDHLFSITTTTSIHRSPTIGPSSVPQLTHMDSGTAAKFPPSQFETPSFQPVKENSYLPALNLTELAAGNALTDPDYGPTTFSVATHMPHSHSLTFQHSWSTDNRSATAMDFDSSMSVSCGVAAVDHRKLAYLPQAQSDDYPMITPPYSRASSTTSQGGVSLSSNQTYQTQFTGASASTMPLLQQQRSYQMDGPMNHGLPPHPQLMSVNSYSSTATNTTQALSSLRSSAVSTPTPTARASASRIPAPVAIEPPRRVLPTRDAKTNKRKYVDESENEDEEEDEENEGEENDSTESGSEQQSSAHDDEDESNDMNDNDDDSHSSYDLPTTPTIRERPTKAFAYSAGTPLDQLPGRARCACEDCKQEAEESRNKRGRGMQSPKKKSRRESSSQTVTTSRLHAQELVSQCVNRTIRPHLKLVPTELPSYYDVPDAELVYRLHHRVLRDQMTQEALKLVLGCAAGKLSTLLRMTATSAGPVTSSKSKSKKSGRKVKHPPSTISPALRRKIQELCWAMDRQFWMVVRQRFTTLKTNFTKAHTQPNGQIDSELETTWRELLENEVLSICRQKVHQYMFYARSSKQRGLELHLSPCDPLNHPSPKSSSTPTSSSSIAQPTCVYCLGPYTPSHPSSSSAASPSTSERIFGTYVAPSQGRIQFSELHAWLQNPIQESLTSNIDRLHAIELQLVAWLVDRNLMTMHLTHKQRQVARSKELDGLPMDVLRRIKQQNENNSKEKLAQIMNQVRHHQPTSQQQQFHSPTVAPQPFQTNHHDDDDDGSSYSSSAAAYSQSYVNQPNIRR